MRPDLAVHPRKTPCAAKFGDTSAQITHKNRRCTAKYPDNQESGTKKQLHGEE